LIAWSTQPIAPIIGGTLADFVLEPAMKGTGALATVFGPLVGNTSGSGMSLLIFLCGMGATAVGVAGYYFSVIRNAEDILPDHDTMEKVSPEAVPA
jgi:DHA3 family macrolide efflux protein-like MFS transporter